MKKLSYSERRRDHRITSRIVSAAVVSETSLPYNCATLNTPEKSYDIWQSVVAKENDFEIDKETLIVFCTDSHFRPYAWHRISVGCATECPAHPREIFRPIVASGAVGFILMHNHPSGDPRPSRADETVTRKVVELSQMFQIRFMDHVIIGKAAPGQPPYYSFREAGLIP